MSTEPRLNVDSQFNSPSDRIDQICDRFEDEWLSGGKPDLVSFLTSSDGIDVGELFSELVLVEIEYRRRLGASLTKLEYLTKYPKFAVQIEAIDFQHGIASTVSSATSDTIVGFAVAGTRLSHFELIEKVGAGAAGEVWKAMDTRLKRTVAVKIPRHGNLTEKDLQRFLREGQAVAQLRHPNIVAIHEVGRDNKVAFIASEYICGSDLRDSLCAIRLTEKRTAELCASLAEALHHAHEQGVIHRDLKPANILLDEGGEPHITDFGLAKWLDEDRSLTIEGQLLGTPAYMSPEQARGEAKSVDRRSDVYSLGVLLYEMLTGDCPFQGEQAAVINKVIHREPVPLRTKKRTISRDLETICLKAMDKDPSRRYPSAQEMAVDLRRFLRGEPILARRANVLEKIWRWTRRRPAVAASLFLFLIAAGSFGFAALQVKENYDLLGVKTVVISTNPPEARVAFVPLEEKSGEPLLDGRVFAKGSSVSQARLTPGDYLVVAVTRDGRFHEVYRHVPEDTGLLPGTYPHRQFKLMHNGKVRLPPIEIPPSSVTDGMAMIQGSDEFVLGKPGQEASSSKSMAVASFFIDPAEFRVSDFLEVSPNLPRNLQDVPHDFAATVNYDLAMALAEDVGKRLPSEIEFEFAATCRGRCDFPWGNDTSVFVSARTIFEFGPVASVYFDRFLCAPDVHGLCSNVAEWTTSRGQYDSSNFSPDLQMFFGGRVVRGGDRHTLKGDPQVSITSRDPHVRQIVARHVKEPGIGFRCVRTVRPRITYEQFP